MSDFDTFVRLLQHANHDQVIEAAHSLGDLGDARAVPVLIHLLRTTNESSIRNAAAVGLRELGDSAAVPALLSEIRNPKNVSDRGTLVYALQMLDVRSVIVELARTFCDGNYEVLQMGLFVIEGIKGPLNVTSKQDAIGVIQRCLDERMYTDWQADLLHTMIERLEEHDEL
ncbi:MAG: hypothetical protein NVS2B7_16370 [Herpetosiphon sp.]